jgi:hypothetical protein
MNTGERWPKWRDLDSCGKFVTVAAIILFVLTVNAMLN